MWLLSAVVVFAGVADGVAVVFFCLFCMVF